MSVIDKLATSLGRRDEVPNQELAKEIATDNDKAAVKELVINLGNKDKNLQSDCIKVIYEIGCLKPKLVAPYYSELVRLLDHKNNRLQWGAMTALNTIVDEMPEVIFESLPKLVSAADAGSVITKDNLMTILIKLAAIPRYAEDAFALFLEQLIGSPSNQVPMYAENALPIINAENRTTFIRTLQSRLGDFEKESKRKRVEKVLKKVLGR